MAKFKLLVYFWATSTLLLSNFGRWLQWLLDSGASSLSSLGSNVYVDITSFFFDGIAWHRATLICANLQPLHFGRFQVVQPAGGATAHLSNPLRMGRLCPCHWRCMARPEEAWFFTRTMCSNWRYKDTAKVARLVKSYWFLLVNGNKAMEMSFFLRDRHLKLRCRSCVGLRHLPCFRDLCCPYREGQVLANGWDVCKQGNKTWIGFNPWKPPRVYRHQ